jgi:predicted GTPase
MNFEQFTQRVVNTWDALLAMGNNHSEHERLEKERLERERKCIISNQISELKSKSETFINKHNNYNLRVLILGFQHHGKSSFINSVYHVLNENWDKPFLIHAPTGELTVVNLRFLLSHSNFLIFVYFINSGGYRTRMTTDSRKYNVNEIIHLFDTPEIGDKTDDELFTTLSQHFDKFKPDCVLVVMSLSEFESKRDLSNYLFKVVDYIRHTGISLFEIG